MFRKKVAKLTFPYLFFKSTLQTTLGLPSQSERMVRLPLLIILLGFLMLFVLRTLPRTTLFPDYLNLLPQSGSLVKLLLAWVTLLVTQLATKPTGCFAPTLYLQVPVDLLTHAQRPWVKEKPLDIQHAKPLTPPLRCNTNLYFRPITLVQPLPGNAVLKAFGTACPWLTRTLEAPPRKQLNLRSSSLPYNFKLKLMLVAAAAL